MPTVIAEPGAVNANSYNTVAGVDAILEERLYTSGWDDADQPTQETLAIWATRLIDDMWNFAGWRTTTTQALQWPRHGVYDRDDYPYPSDELPPVLLRAHALLALHLTRMAPSQQSTLQQLGVKQIDLGAVTIDLSSAAAELDIPLMPDEVSDLLRQLGELRPSSTLKSNMNARVYRT